MIIKKFFYNSLFNCFLGLSAATTDAKIPKN